MADGQQARDELGRFARTKPRREQRPHPCELLARTFNPPPASASASRISGNFMRSRIGSSEIDALQVSEGLECIGLPNDVSWRRQFDDAMAVGIACVATGLPSDLLLARWAGQDHRGLACRLVFARLEEMGLSRGKHPARVAVAWVVAQVLSPPPRSLKERPATVKKHVAPPVTIREAARQAHIAQADFRVLTRVVRAVLGDMLRELERAYCEARFAGF